ncbi:F-box domain protein [Talaromyces proteolyticus]|uniref:F-box domain protein n=1 Tax=Talaromyces proteolyticus TaxID=1131652 RepID=A0AAD4Q2L3_9EURO|nr:F-box domain protein [Talaromyces proteolyticus]KAH8700506.1 F-box domain protein [Talaromyces proteolyticus]
MLADLPSEIIYHIATFLPTASSLTHLAQTCQRLHKIVSADGRIFRAFVQSQFSTLDGAPPYWKDVAQALTSRSRALDRCAIFARFMLPLEDAKVVGVAEPTRHDRPTIGYRPSLDSYEVWTGERWEDREEVLAWGAAEKILLRTRKTGNNAHEKWLCFNDLEDVSSHDDIRSVHLLRPNHPRKIPGNEHIIYGRARGNVEHVAINPDDATSELQQTFVTNQTELHSLDLSPGTEPILAVHNSGGTISLYRTATEDKTVSSFSTLKGETEEGTPRHYSKFLGPTRLAVGYGRKTDSIVVSDILGDQIATVREFGFDDPYHRTLWPRRKARVGAIAPLSVDNYGGSAHGEVFLAGWGNSRVRLHDLRSPKMYEQEYIDVMDSNPIYCIQPMNNRFLVGAGAEAVVNIFDLRMRNAYSHFDATMPSSVKTNGTSPSMPQGNFSCFLSHHPPGATRNRYGTYRGPIYTMSSPSSTSATVYTGIVDGVMRLDLGSTDDLIGAGSAWYQNHLDISMEEINMKSDPAQPAEDRLLELSGYERPSPESKSTSAKLRTQVPLWSLSEIDEVRERETGWDRRWRRLDENSSWRSRGNS